MTTGGTAAAQSVGSPKPPAPSSGGAYGGLGSQLPGPGADPGSTGEQPPPSSSGGAYGGLGSQLPGPGTGSTGEQPPPSSSGRAYGGLGSQLCPCVGPQAGAGGHGAGAGRRTGATVSYDGGGARNLGLLAVAAALLVGGGVVLARRRTRPGA